MKDFPETLEEARQQAKKVSKDAEHIVYVFRRGSNYIVSGGQLSDTIVTAYRKGKEVND